MYWTTHIRPRSSKWRLSGWVIAGSCATSFISSPGATLKCWIVSSGVSGFEPSSSAPLPLKLFTNGGSVGSTSGPPVWAGEEKDPKASAQSAGARWSKVATFTLTAALSRGERENRCPSLSMANPLDFPRQFHEPPGLAVCAPERSAEHRLGPLEYPSPNRFRPRQCSALRSIGEGKQDTSAEENFSSFIDQEFRAPRPELVETGGPGLFDFVQTPAGADCFKRRRAFQQALDLVQGKFPRVKPLQCQRDREADIHRVQLVAVGDRDFYAAALFVLKRARRGSKAHGREIYAGKVRRIQISGELHLLHVWRA